MSNTATVSSIVPLSGRTAKELRELLAAGSVTPAAVAAHLAAKATLRPQSLRLLEELNGAKAAKAAAKVAAKAAAKPAPAPAPAPVKVEAAPAPAPAKEAKAPRVTNETLLAAIAGLAARMDGLEAKVDRFASFLATVEATPSAATPAPEVKVEAPVVAEDIIPVEQDDNAPLAYAEAKARYEAETVATLRETAKSLDLPTTGKKADLIGRILACYCEMGLVLPAPVNATANGVAAEF